MRTQGARPGQNSPPDALGRARDQIEATAFLPSPGGTVGAELELLVVPAPGVEPPALVELEDLLDAVGALPGGSLLTLEPGGQVELSAPPLPLAAVTAVVARDLARLRSVFADRGLALVGMGVGPWPDRSRLRRNARYEGMERHWHAVGCADAGETMMRQSASVQVNVDAGPDPARRWALLHRIGPALVAAFADSPMRHGRVEGWASHRQQLWLEIEAGRARPVWPGSWADYALQATVMFAAGVDIASPPGDGLTLGAWVGGGHPAAGLPTEADVATHLTTLFPPVRPRGFLEVRYVDAQPGRWWAVPALVIGALAEDAAAGDEAVAACSMVDGWWQEAARAGTAESMLHAAAVGVIAAAADALPRLGVGPADVALVRSFAARLEAPGWSWSAERAAAHARTGQPWLDDDGCAEAWSSS